MKRLKSAGAILLAAAIPAQAGAAIPDIYLKCTVRWAIWGPNPSQRSEMVVTNDTKQVFEQILWIGNNRLSVMSAKGANGWSENWAGVCPGALEILDGSIRYEGCGSLNRPWIGAGGTLIINRLNGAIEAITNEGDRFESRYNGKCEKINNPTLNKAF